jgi:hypothetical protein
MHTTPPHSFPAFFFCTHQDLPKQGCALHTPRLRQDRTNYLIETPRGLRISFGKTSIKVAATGPDGPAGVAASAALWLNMLSLREGEIGDGERGGNSELLLGMESRPPPTRMLDDEVDDSSFLFCLSSGEAVTEGVVEGPSSSSGCLAQPGAPAPAPSPRALPLSTPLPIPEAVTSSFGRAFTDTNGAAQSVFSQVSAWGQEVRGGLHQAVEGPKLAVKGFSHLGSARFAPGR